MFGSLKKLFRSKVKSKSKEEERGNFRYYKHYKIIGDRELNMYSDKVIDDKKVEEIVKFIEDKVHILEDPDMILSEVMCEVVYDILDNKAMVSLSIMNNEYNMYIIYNIKPL